MAELSISIDDICPHPKCKNEEVVDRINDLRVSFDALMVTMFLPTAYTRLNEKSYFISKYIKFIDWIKSLDRSIFKLGWHGHFHGDLKESSNDEFRNGSYKFFLSRLYEMEEEADKAGILEYMSPVFRPPAFWMNPEAFKAVSDFGIKTLALSKFGHHLSFYGGKDKTFPKVSYVTSLPPYAPLVYEENMDIVYHAYSDDQNFLNGERAGELKVFLDENINRIEFKGFTEI